MLLTITMIHAPATDLGHLLHKHPARVQTFDLSYHGASERHPLDERAPEWSDSEQYTVTLAGTLRLCDLLSHLYVLGAVLDDEKHYWIGEDEAAKLLRYGEGWLARHLERELIA